MGLKPTSSTLSALRNLSGWTGVFIWSPSIAASVVVALQFHKGCSLAGRTNKKKPPLWINRFFFHTKHINIKHSRQIENDCHATEFHYWMTATMIMRAATNEHDDSHLGAPTWARALIAVSCVFNGVSAFDSLRVAHATCVFMFTLGTNSGKQVGLPFRVRQPGPETRWFQGVKFFHFPRKTTG